MRKRLILTAVLLTASLAGCGGAGHESLASRYIFRDEYGSISQFGSAPYKVNPATGLSTSICVDPLCPHTGDSGCPFYRADGYLAAGDTMFLARSEPGTNGIGEHFELIAYNLTDGSSRLLAESHDPIFLEASDGQSVWYAQAHHNKDDGGEFYTYRLYRADSSGGVIELPLDTDSGVQSQFMSTGDYPNIYAIDGGRIYWNFIAGEREEFFTTDLVGEDRRELDFGGNLYVMNGEAYDGWAYYTTFNRERGTKMDQLESTLWLSDLSLWRVKLTGGKPQLVSDSVSRYIITDSGIYYTAITGDPVLVADDGGKHYDIFDGCIRRMDHDGGGAAILCRTGMDLSLYGRDCFLGSAVWDGCETLALAFMEWRENDFYESGREYRVSPDTLLIDTVTGTTSVSRYTEAAQK